MPSSSCREPPPEEPWPPGISRRCCCCCCWPPRRSLWEASDRTGVLEGDTRMGSVPTHACTGHAGVTSWELHTRRQHLPLPLAHHHPLIQHGTASMMHTVPLLAGSEDRRLCEHECTLLTCLRAQCVRWLGLAVLPLTALGDIQAGCQGKGSQSRAQN
eukprot:1139377-Pelagomonas_calceolata.AAC.8